MFEAVLWAVGRKQFKNATENELKAMLNKWEKYFSPCGLDSKK